MSPLKLVTLHMIGPQCVKLSLSPVSRRVSDKDGTCQVVVGVCAGSPVDKGLLRVKSWQSLKSSEINFVGQKEEQRGWRPQCSTDTVIV